MARFGSMITAMITPFFDDGRLDLAGAAELAVWLVDQGNDALVLTGSTGEASVLTDDEQIEVWRAVRAAVDVPLIVGSGTNDTSHACELTAEAARTGVDAVLLVTPYYNRPPQAGLEAHFRSVAAATDLPVLAEVIVRLATEVSNVVGLKDAAGDATETARVVADTPDDFEVYAGDDSWALPMIAVGAVGVISVAGHWAAAEMGQMIEAFQRGDHDAARALNARLLASYDFESGDLTPNPIPAKAMMRALGQPSGQCRMPMGPASAGLDQQALAVWNNLHA